MCTRRVRQRKEQDQACRECSRIKYQTNNHPSSEICPDASCPYGRKRARVPIGVRGGWFRKKGAGIMAVARPEPLFDWFIPIDGDGVHLGTLAAERPPTFAYLREVVQTSEQLGFHALLIPTRFVNGLFDEGAPLAETWSMATALAAVTSRIRFLIAIRPGFIAA